MRDAANELYSCKNSSSDIRLTLNEELSILSEIKSKSSSLDELCVHQSPEATDIQEIFGMVANLYAKDIVQKNLHFSYEINANTKTVTFNNLLFSQLNIFSHRGC